MFFKRFKNGWNNTMDKKQFKKGKILLQTTIILTNKQLIKGNNNIQNKLHNQFNHRI